MKIYISGGITNVPDYSKHFAMADVAEKQIDGQMNIADFIT